MSFRDYTEHRRNKELKRRYRGRQLTVAHWGGFVIEETDMSIELKIKVKNLADEARTIRKEEQKLHGMAKWKLQHHRKTVVRDAARRTLIAYQWIRGKNWVQHVSHDEYKRRGDCKEIERMVRKYGVAQSVESLNRLIEALQASLKKAA